jgi:hypothetical protein
MILAFSTFVSRMSSRSERVTVLGFDFGDRLDLSFALGSGLSLNLALASTRRARERTASGAMLSGFGISVSITSIIVILYG